MNRRKFLSYALIGIAGLALTGCMTLNRIYTDYLADPLDPVGYELERQGFKYQYSVPHLYKEIRIFSKKRKNRNTIVRVAEYYKSNPSVLGPIKWEIDWWENLEPKGTIYVREYDDIFAIIRGVWK